MESLKDLVDCQRSMDEEHTAKRVRMQCEVDIEKIKSEERIAQIQVESNKRTYL